MTKSIRTFIGLPIPDPIGHKLTLLREKLAEQLTGVKWVSSAGYHLTLNFLGDVLDTDLHSVCKAVIEVARSPVQFEATVDGIGMFPNPSRPKVIWAGINDQGDRLIGLHRDLAKALTALGYRSEEPRFHPHVTLGRLKHDRGPTVDLTHLITKHRTWSGGSFRVRELTVFASHFGQDGPVYTRLGRAPLRNGKIGSKA